MPRVINTSLGLCINNKWAILILNYSCLLWLPFVIYSETKKRIYHMMRGSRRAKNSKNGFSLNKSPSSCDKYVFLVSEYITNGHHNKQLLLNINFAHLLFIQRPRDVFNTQGMENAVVISYKCQYFYNIET